MKTLERQFLHSITLIKIPIDSSHFHNTNSSSNSPTPSAFAEGVARETALIHPVNIHIRRKT